MRCNTAQMRHETVVTHREATTNSQRRVGLRLPTAMIMEKHFGGSWNNYVASCSSLSFRRGRSLCSWSCRCETATQGGTRRLDRACCIERISSAYLSSSCEPERLLLVIASHRGREEERDSIVEWWAPFLSIHYCALLMLWL
jgi:hypothetical protein